MRRSGGAAATWAWKGAPPCLGWAAPATCGRRSFVCAGVLSVWWWGPPAPSGYDKEAWHWRQLFRLLRLLARLSTRFTCAELAGWWHAFPVAAPPGHLCLKGRWGAVRAASLAVRWRRASTRPGNTRRAQRVSQGPACCKLPHTSQSQTSEDISRAAATVRSRRG